MGEERNWEELDTDCLINIFGRIDTETIAKSVQFVCKSWFQTTLNPQCWQNLVFSLHLSWDEDEFYYTDTRILFNEFVTSALARSKESATCVIFKHGFDITDESLLCISESCPFLKILALPPSVNVKLEWQHHRLSELLHNWKHLECITIYDFTCQYTYNFRYTELLESISLHSKNLIEFSCPQSDIDDEEAISIVQYLPNIKVLRMNYCHLSRSALLIILKGCSELEYVDASGCTGFDQNDDEIINLAMRIRFFDSSGSTLKDGYEDYDDYGHGSGYYDQFDAFGDSD